MALVAGGWCVVRSDCASNDRECNGECSTGGREREGGGCIVTVMVQQLSFDVSFSFCCVYY